MDTNNPNEVVTVTDSHKICRNRDQANILTVEQMKDYRIVFDKRVRKDHMSCPYGFV